MTVYPDSVRTFDAAVRYDRPLAFWRMDEANGTAIDDEISALDGVLNGTYAQNQPGPIPGSASVDFTGSAANAYVSIASTTGLPTNAPCTIEAWIYPDSHAADGIFGYGDFSTALRSNLIRLGTSNTLLWDWWGGGANVLTVTLPASLSDAWHHIVGTWDGTTRRLFVDGLQVGADYPTGTPNWSLSNVRIGRTSSDYFDGRISRVAFYNAALTNEQVLFHYQAAVGILPHTLADVIAGVDTGVTWNYRYFKSDHDLTIGEDVSRFVENGGIDMSTDRAVKKHLGLRMLDNDVISEVSDHLFVFAELTDDDGQIFSVPLGLFHLDFVPQQEHMSTHSSWIIDAYDQGIHLHQQQTTEPYVAPASANVIDHVASLLQSLGITLINIPVSSATLAVSLSWDTGTPYLQVIGDLLNLVGYYTPWFDNNNYCVSRPFDDLEKTAPAVVYATDEKSMVLPPFRTEVNSDRFANQVVVISEDPQNPLVGRATNSDPASPISTVTLGYTKTKLIHTSVNTQADADARARVELQRAAAIYRSGKLPTSADPRRQPHELYELNIYRRTPLNYQDFILAHGAALYWRLGEVAGSFLDVSGHANHGVLTGGSDAVRNIVGPLRSTEDDGAVRIVDPATTIRCASVSAFPSVGFWDECWIYMAALPTADLTVYTFDYAVGSTRGRRVTIDTDGLLKGQCASSGSTTSTVNAQIQPLPINRWIHITFAHFGAQMWVFADAIVAAAANLSGATAHSIAGAFQIGPVSDVGSGFSIDEMVVYSKRTEKLSIVEQRIADHRELAEMGSGLVADGKWWALGWTMPLDPGAQMDHTVARVESIG